MSTGLFWYYARLYHESHVNFDDKDGNVFEQIKVREFNFEQKKERKLVCTTKNYFKTLSPAEKKGHGNDFRCFSYRPEKSSRSEIFVFEQIYNRRNQNFLKGIVFLNKINARLALGYDLDERYIYELRLKKL